MGISLVGPYDTTDEIEDLVKAFRAEITSSRTESVDESEAESKFDDLYKVNMPIVSCYVHTFDCIEITAE